MFQFTQKVFLFTGETCNDLQLPNDEVRPHFGNQLRIHFNQLLINNPCSWSIEVSSLWVSGHLSDTYSAFIFGILFNWYPLLIKLLA